MDNVPPSSPERALLVGICRPEDTKGDAKESFVELGELALTAGAHVVERVFFSVDIIQPKSFLGQGRVARLAQLVSTLAIDVVIFDVELNPRQGVNLEKALSCKIIDRTGLILHIFAKRARSRAGKLQVELAQLNYLLPRLVGHWTHFSRQRGGIGTQGPGETQLEVDRRCIRERIHRLQSQLAEVQRTRSLHRQKRQVVPIPVVGLMGYTNAGKSTLFNALPGAQSVSAPRLFATLDPKTKYVRLPSGRIILLGDTVGFIRRLPHEIVEAFKATFEEMAESDCLVHVLDGSHPHCREQLKIVHRVLQEIGLDQKPMLTVLNKCDISSWSGNGLKELASSACRVSALTGEGVAGWLKQLDQTLAQNLHHMSLVLPHHCGALINRLYEQGRVLEVKALETGMALEVEVGDRLYATCQPFEIASQTSQ